MTLKKGKKWLTVDGSDTPPVWQWFWKGCQEVEYNGYLENEFSTHGSWNTMPPSAVPIADVVSATWISATSGAQLVADRVGQSRFRLTYRSPTVKPSSWYERLYELAAI